MQKLKEQTDAKIALGRKKNPEFMKGVDEIINEAKAFQKGKNAIKIGEKAPNFELPNPLGKQIKLLDLLSKGPVVITFYHGSQCPYCYLQLRALQDKLKDIHLLGATLVAINPEVPDSLMTKSEISNMEFTVLSDQDAKIAAQYGVAWDVPEFLLMWLRLNELQKMQLIYTTT